MKIENIIPRYNLYIFIIKVTFNDIKNQIQNLRIIKFFFMKQYERINKLIRYFFKKFINNIRNITNLFYILLNIFFISISFEKIMNKKNN